MSRMAMTAQVFHHLCCQRGSWGWIPCPGLGWPAVRSLRHLRSHPHVGRGRGDCDVCNVANADAKNRNTLPVPSTFRTGSDAVPLHAEHMSTWALRTSLECLVELRGYLGRLHPFCAFCPHHPEGLCVMSASLNSSPGLCLSPLLGHLDDVWLCHHLFLYLLQLSLELLFGRGPRLERQPRFEFFFDGDAVLGRPVPSWLIHQVALLIAVDPKKAGIIHEIYVFKHYRMVQLFQMVSYGRRWYRSLFFTTDCRYTLLELTPSTQEVRCCQIPPLLRYAGVSDSPAGDGTGCVLFRDKIVPQNKSGTEEQFIPARLLHGVLPSALLKDYIFWQDDNDNIRGYPEGVDPKEMDHYCYVELDPPDQHDHQAIKVRPLLPSRGPPLLLCAPWMQPRSSHPSVLPE